MKYIFPKLYFQIEKWKFNEDLKIYVSTLGNFKDINKNPIMPKINKHGYMKIRVNNQNYSVHRVVLMTWHPLDDYTNMSVDHINHNKRDNSLRNLEWVSLEENLERALKDLSTNEKYNQDDTFVLQAHDIITVATWLVRDKDMNNVEISEIADRISVAMKNDKIYCGYLFKEVSNGIIVFRRGKGYDDRRI